MRLQHLRKNLFSFHLELAPPFSVKVTVVSSFSYCPAQLQPFSVSSSPGSRFAEAPTEIPSDPTTTDGLILTYKTSKRKMHSNCGIATTKFDTHDLLLNKIYYYIYTHRKKKRKKIYSKTYLVSTSVALKHQLSSNICLAELRCNFSCSVGFSPF